MAKPPCFLGCSQLKLQPKAEKLEGFYSVKMTELLQKTKLTPIERQRYNVGDRDRKIYFSGDSL